MTKKTHESSQKKSLGGYARLFITGFMMGAADIVPGVSGGTIAFIFGIYEQLLEAVKTMSGEVVRAALKFDIKKAWQLVPFAFLIPLALGLLTAVVSVSSFIEYSLEHYPVYLWSYFFGLVLISIWIVRQRVNVWSKKAVSALGLAAIGAFLLVGLVPVQTPANPIAFLISGAIAICAMILPGVSGSFLLVMMGKYEQILSAVVERDLVTIGFVGIGAVLGLAFFSRFLQWLFAKYHDVAVATLIGFMIGSLRKIWPWKNVLETMETSKGEIIPVKEQMALPDSFFSTEFILAALLCAIGIATIVLLNKLQEKMQTERK